MFGTAQAEDAAAAADADANATSAAYRRQQQQHQQNQQSSALYSQQVEASNGGGGSPYRSMSAARQSPYPGLPTGYYAAAAAAAASLAAVGDYPAGSHPSAHHAHAAGGVYSGMDAAAAAAAWHAYNAPLGPLYQRYDQAMDWGQQDFSDPSFSSFGCGFPPPPPPPPRPPPVHNGDCSASLGPPSPSEYKDFGPYVVQRVSAPANGASPDSGLAADSPLEAMAQNASSGSGTTVKAEPSPSSGTGTGAGNRPQPARSPYEWMKRPAFAARTSSAKEGRTRTKDKYRVVYSDHQRLELEKEFHYSRYITIRRKAELATALSLSERQVKIWFQNRRAKERKHMKKRDEMIHKEKLDAAASLHAAAAVGHAQHAMFTATAGMFHHHHHPAMALPHI